jgi:hypothetical protein
VQERIASLNRLCFVIHRVNVILPIPTMVIATVNFKKENRIERSKSDQKGAFRPEVGRAIQTYHVDDGRYRVWQTQIKVLA